MRPVFIVVTGGVLSGLGKGVTAASLGFLLSRRHRIIPVKCDQHGWMSAYIVVAEHPYYAVTDDRGAFRLRDVPPGRYTLEAWHEKLGTQTQTVTVGDGESASITFEFKWP